MENPPFGESRMNIFKFFWETPQKQIQEYLNLWSHWGRRWDCLVRVKTWQIMATLKAIPKNRWIFCKIFKYNININHPLLVPNIC